MTELRYEPLPNYSKQEIERIVKSGDITEIARLPLGIGMNHTNWKKAQDICIELSNHENEIVSSNAILGLAYVARMHGKLEKHLVKPVLINNLKKHNEYKWRIQDAIDDINIFMKWNIGVKN